MSLRKSIPIIGSISSGKSLFLDNLLNLDLLESHSNTTTKFVCIIRHNKALSKPKFYHIKLIQKGINKKTGMKEYDSSQDGEVISGYEQIKQKIRQINKEQKDINDNNIKHEELFYILETKIDTITNEELLLNYDFYDIPRLDEYIGGDKPQKNNNKNNNMKYIDNLFKYFRSRIDFGIFVLNAETAYVNSSHEIIINIANILKPKKIKNYLIILNKIDRKSAPNEAINEVKAILVNDLLDQLNLPDNTFISLDSRQIKHRNLLKEHFNHFLLFLFNQYVSKSVIPFKDSDSNKKIKNKYHTKLYPFSDFLYDFIFEEDMNDTEKDDYLTNLENEFEKGGFSLEKIGIIDIVENVKNMEGMYIKYNIDFENDESIQLFKALYIIFKKGLKFPFSQQVSDVYDYFNTILNKIQLQETLELFPLKQDDNLIYNHFFDKFDKFIQEFQSNNDALNNNISSLYNSAFYQQFFYIGIFGNSCTGKSSVFNNIIGYDILPVNQGECTKRGIVIEYGKEIALFKAKSQINYLSQGQSFLVFQKKEIIVSGLNNVKEYLTLLNSKYAKNTSMKYYDYFIVTLPIKYFEEINVDQNLINKIKFIDLPGYNTSTAQKNFYFDAIINSISLFTFNFTNESIGSTDNIFIKKIYEKYKRNNISCKNALMNILYNVNIFQINDFNECIINDWKKNIKKVLYEVYDKEKEGNDMNIKITYINSKACQYYDKNNITYIKDYNTLYEDLVKLYNLKGKKGCLSDFVLKQIKNDLMEMFDMKSKEFNEIISKGKYSSDIYGKIIKLLQFSFPNAKEEKNLKQNIQSISSCLTYIKDNIKLTKYYKMSHRENFFKDLTKAINSSNKYKINYFNKLFSSTTEQFKIFFQDDEEYKIINFMNNFNSFYSLFQDYKLVNFSLSPEIKKLKKLLNDKYDYYITKIKVKKFGKGKTHGASNEYDWNNGIIQESEKPKIYSKIYEKSCEGKFLSKMRLYLDEEFDDIIVGWKIDSCWRDGTNGEWYMDENPLLSNKFKCRFISQLFRGQRFKIYIYLMQYPK